MADAASTTRQRLIDLLAIGRTSNLPTVWSNVTVGFLLAWCFGAASRPMPENFSILVVLLIACSFAYLFGTFLNDWQDADFDREHRPERAIPSGRWSQRAILTFALSFGGLALVGFLYLGFQTLGSIVTGLFLVAAILVYTRTHKKTPTAVIPMGLCRSALYFLGNLSVPASAAAYTTLAAPSSPSLEQITNNDLLILTCMALGIFCYVAGLTLAARYESRPEGFRAPRLLFWALLFMPFLTHTWWWLWERPPFLEGWKLAIPCLIGLVPFVAWTVRSLVVLRSSIPDFVGRSLAGLCLVDLLAFPGIAATIYSGSNAIDSASLLLAIVPLACFILALLLQRIAPAT